MDNYIDENYEMDNNILIVTGENGVQYNIRVIDIFTVDEFPEKEYIVYTFEETIDEQHIRAYISILNETETHFSLLGISNKEEWAIVQEKFNQSINSLLNNQNAE